MYISPYTVQLLHEDRLREAQRHYSRNRLIRDLAEPTPIEIEGGWLYTIKQWLRPQRQERLPETRDVRRATVV
jgi:hypothetical protein